jgi:predicted unusual protein kinase regulating ubiquinone biosynthesis (AarF/ABC1/UbiB family)
VAATLLDSYLKQIFEDGFFHADPHPGNLFVTPNGAGTDGAGPDGWRLTFVDFGMVGHVPEKMLQGLREMLFAVGTQDAARIVRAYQIMGVLLPSADLELLERAEAEAFRRFWGKNMSELQRLGAQEIREFAAEFQALIYTLPFQIPQDFIFLARAVGILSGMCTGLDPKFNVWEHLAPYARKLMSAEARPAAEAWLEQLGNLARSMLNVPVKMDQILNKLESGQVAVKSPELVRQVEQLKVAARQVTGGVVFAALLLGAVQLYLGGAVELGLALAGAAALSLAWLLTRKT